MKEAAFYLCLLLLLGCSEDAKNQDTLEDDNSMSDMISQEARVTITDPAFEQALIDLNYDTDLDGEVAKNRIDFITELIIDDKGISNLTGIEAFDALESLNVRNNQLTVLELNRNTNLLFIWAEGNQLENINVTGLSSLEKLGLDQNALTEVAVRTNTALQLLTVSENRLMGIDVSNNTALTDFTVVANPLNCILVNETQFNDIPTDWVKDETDSYALDCQ